MKVSAESVEQSLENALEHAESEEAKYWIRTALQIVIGREEPENDTSE